MIYWEQIVFICWFPYRSWLSFMHSMVYLNLVSISLATLYGFLTYFLNPCTTICILLSTACLSVEAFVKLYLEYQGQCEFDWTWTLKNTKMRWITCLLVILNHLRNYTYFATITDNMVCIFFLAHKSVWMRTVRIWFQIVKAIGQAFANCAFSSLQWFMNQYA